MDPHLLEMIPFRSSKEELFHVSCFRPVAPRPVAPTTPGGRAFRVVREASESIWGATHARSNALSLLACSRRGIPEDAGAELGAVRRRFRERKRRVQWFGQGKSMCVVYFLFTGFCSALKSPTHPRGDCFC